MASVTRGPNFKSVPLELVGGSVFGRHPKIDAQHTFNMYVTTGGNQEFLVNYAGYKIGIDKSVFSNPESGRGIYVSTKLDKMFVVYDENVYMLNFGFDQVFDRIESLDPSIIGELLTRTGQVYFAENNKPQILISDGLHLYVYDKTLINFTTDVTAFPGSNFISYTGERIVVQGEPVVFQNTGSTGITAGLTYYVSTVDTTSTPGTIKFTIAANITNAYNLLSPITITPPGGPFSTTFSTQGTFQQVPLSFTPGHVSFHDTYGLCAASHDGYYEPLANNTWRLSASNNFLMWPDDSTTIGALETKPDNTKAVFRFPSGGNLIFVMGETVTESWTDTGTQLFPYQRNNQYNLDYGCISPNSVAQLDNIAVWVAQNEKTGPVIMFSTGQLPQTITTDGISYRLSNLENPEDCSAFIFRQYGHTIYNINFRSDNISLFYDFTLKKFYESSDQDMNFYHISELVFYKNQYFGISRESGELYIVDSRITYYEQKDEENNRKIYEIPRIRTTNNIRIPSQDYFIVNDVGFTIETGETNYWPYSITTEPSDPYAFMISPVTNPEYVLITQNSKVFVSEQLNPDTSSTTTYNLVPKVGLSISRNGGASFGSFYDKTLPAIGQRKSRLLWWQCGVCNDLVCKIRFLGYGRIIATNGIINIRS